MIKDSGDRTEFETGAKRDMHAGKGRMDLLPWYGIMEVSKHCEEGALKYGEHNVDKGYPAAFASGQCCTTSGQVHGRHGRRGPPACCLLEPAVGIESARDPSGAGR